MRSAEGLPARTTSRRRRKLLIHKEKIIYLVEYQRYSEGDLLSGTIQGGGFIVRDNTGRVDLIPRSSTRVGIDGAVVSGKGNSYCIG